MSNVQAEDSVNLFQAFVVKDLKMYFYNKCSQN